MPSRHLPHPLKPGLALLLAVASLTAAAPPPAQAQPATTLPPTSQSGTPGAPGLAPEDGAAREVPVVEAGRERDVQALVLPFKILQPVAKGWELKDIVIAPRAIRFVMRHAQPAVDLGDPGCELVVRHRDFPGPDAEAALATASFSSGRVLPRAAERDTCAEALAAVHGALAKGDDGSFWRAMRSSDWVEAAADDSRWLVALLGPGGWLRDGLLLGLLALLLVLVLLAKQLRREPAWVALALLAIALAGLALRWTMAVEAPMAPWPYQRIPPLSRTIWYGPGLRWLSEVTGATFTLQDTVFTTQLVLSAFTPLVFFSHARFLLGDVRSSVAAAALIAVLPQHLRMSASDVAFIQSTLLTSLGFSALYVALTDTSRAWRAFAYVALAAIVTGGYLTRPLNVIFSVVYAGPILFLTGAHMPRGRRVVALTIVTVSAAAVFFTAIVGDHGDALDTGTSLGTIVRAIETFFDPQLNTFANPRITPPLLALLSLGGLVWLLRHGKPRVAGYLVLWWGAFFVAHGVIVLPRPAAMARYHLHLVTPMVLAAAAATPWVLGWPAQRRRLGRVALVAAGAILLTSPWLHRAFIRDVAFDMQEEFAFLQDATTQIPDGCTVLEPLPITHKDRFLRTARFADVIRGGDRTPRYTAVPMVSEAFDERQEGLTEDALSLLSSPGGCLMVAETLACMTGDPQRPYAQACLDVRRRVRLEPVAETTVTSRHYDPSFTLGLEESGGGPWPVGLYRVAW